MTGRFLLFLTPLSYFDPQQRSLKAFWQVLSSACFSTDKTVLLISACFQLSARKGQPELPHFKMRGRPQGSGFPTVQQAAPTNSGPVVLGNGYGSLYAACVLTLACSEQTGLVAFPSQGPQPIHPLLCVLLASCRKCTVLVPQFPHIFVFCVSQGVATHC